MTMKRMAVIVAAVLLAAACSERKPSAKPSAAPAIKLPPESRKPGALEIRVDPNPIVAIPLNPSTYEFPFTVSIRETGGTPVTVIRVGMDVYSVAGLRIYTSELGPEEIERRGYIRTLAANGEVRYTWRPRAQVPDERLFATTWGELWVEGADARGAPVATRTRVTVRAPDLPGRR